MFAWWGRTVYRFRYIVIAITVGLSLFGGIFGISLGKHVTQSGFYDDGSQSVKASVLGDDTYGRDRTSHIVATFTAPKSLSDPAWQHQMVDELNAFKKNHSDQVVGWAGWLAAPTSTDPVIKGMASDDGKHTFVSIPLKGNDDDTILTNYKTIEPDLQKLNGGKVQLAGLEPIASALTGTIATDQKRMEVLALPLVAVVLFLVFGGVVAAALPVMVGGLSIAGSLGVLRFLTMFGPMHFFAQPVVSMMGFGIAIDYGLFVVSRFREEIAEGYDTEAAVRRTVMTAGRTVVFSAVLIAVSAASLFLLPQGFVKSLTYAVIISVSLAAVLSITLLPACLAVLGRNVDALGVRTLFRIPFLANWTPSRVYLNWLADRLQKTKTREEVEAGFWGKLVNVVMRRPLVFAIPIVIGMIALVIPLHNLSFGGMSEKYLPPNNSVRLAQENFDKLFPGYRTNQLTLVIKSNNGSKVTDQQIAEIRSDAASITGFTDKTWQERACPAIEGNPCVAGPNGTTKPKDDSVRVIQNGLSHASDAAKKLTELRSITPPKGLTVLVGGVPALEQDSIHSLFDKAPLMLVVLLSTTMLLMFLAFGSVVLPIKAAVMSALTLGSTLGILTWIFVDGHLASLLNFTPTPLMVVLIALVIAVGFGLATDYEVFLVSRMVEARARGMSTAEAIRIGTATTGRLITAAALVLAVVAGSFVFSDLVMMKYLAFGLMAALLLDATVVRMFLVPSVMKLLGDDCWWAPMWMKRLQNRLGLGEIHLPDERKRPVPRTGPERPAVAAQTAASTAAKPRPPHDPTHPGADGQSPRPSRPAGPAPRPEFRPPAQETPSAAGTTKMPAAGRGDAKEAPTTRFSAQPSAAAAPVPSHERPPTPAGPAPRDDREIESWLSDLRGPGSGDRPTPAQPSADQTRAMQIPREQPSAQQPAGPEDATTAIPTAPQDDKDSDTATEKLNARGENPPRRRGGGLSAADLLRREGRM
ncbi:MMPL family transporter [Mycobacterium cookii]|uniref:Putative trehalose monomycolate exporter MmpL3 n=1 Tax=Mycobacterium cookii TaxID=1775 RepID=A0A7I7KZG6_9MYCO|nr:MMPL family transporter [Mycobacterium cookii]MCV7330302.1 MMPL family transporter [Mycobacterium cookii]BBX47510.1 putative trehalose monomycolate exporter MmpL3 [Mycobacterium cookii]